MKKYVLEVDLFDNPIGKVEKQAAHTSPVLHRAFSVFLYHDNKLLIQQRAKHKYHSGGLWANTCCSHPQSNDIVSEAKERLFEEVGILQGDLKEIFCFTYFHQFDEHLYEYEYDHVLVGEFDGNYKINPDEVEELEWIDIKNLTIDLIKKPQIFAPWFLLAAPKVIEYLNHPNNCFLK